MKAEATPREDDRALRPHQDLRAKYGRLTALLAEMGGCVVACSGGVDSMLLASVAHGALPGRCLVVHAMSAAVPVEDTARVKAFAAGAGWQLRMVTTGEFDDEHYLSNPINRCYYCKSHLYESLVPLAKMVNNGGQGATVLSGANLDDLAEYRPGLEAASQYGIRHPFVEAGLTKADIRAVCRWLGLPFAEIPASPCLASRIYTGTRVTPQRLAAVHFAEQSLKQTLGVQVIRCRLKADHMLVEIPAEDRWRVSEPVLGDLRRDLLDRYPFILSLEADPEPYQPGRAFTEPRHDQI